GRVARDDLVALRVRAGVGPREVVVVSREAHGGSKHRRTSIGSSGHILPPARRRVEPSRVPQWYAAEPCRAETCAPPGVIRALWTTRGVAVNGGHVTSGGDV